LVRTAKQKLATQSPRADRLDDDPLFARRPLTSPGGGSPFGGAPDRELGVREWPTKICVGKPDGRDVRFRMHTHIP
jgi:hypothetical protein